ncbi:hypothetical protein PRIPAC_78760 [Pristionchus pacificus]|uniref:Uncharacterized protein n=1 Tax=Pristionchus pacificus TaxID=54126 RepID=A0A2A6CLB8_PRIPA|nr:hypothetical protein PRIPAC_78760 [Pristionchus pacificus]|eukprot:PDM78909.1 hypothetical protein PRIPAC_31488 [Pristionchus pacificus]
MWTAIVLLSFIIGAQAFPKQPSKFDSCNDALDCNNHGKCVGSPEEGRYCVCDHGYYGLNCQLLDPCIDAINCNGNGKCAGGVEDLHCECFDGW